MRTNGQTDRYDEANRRLTQFFERAWKFPIIGKHAYHTSVYMNLYIPHLMTLKFLIRYLSMFAVNAVVPAYHKHTELPTHVI